MAFKKYQDLIEPVIVAALILVSCALIVEKAFALTWGNLFLTVMGFMWCSEALFATIRDMRKANSFLKAARYHFDLKTKTMSSIGTCAAIASVFFLDEKFYCAIAVCVGLLVGIPGRRARQSIPN